MHGEIVFKRFRRSRVDISPRHGAGDIWATDGHGKLLIRWFALVPVVERHLIYHDRWVGKGNLDCCTLTGRQCTRERRVEGELCRYRAWLIAGATPLFRCIGRITLVRCRNADCCCSTMGDAVSDLQLPVLSTRPSCPACTSTLHPVLELENSATPVIMVMSARFAPDRSRFRLPFHGWKQQRSEK